MSFGDTIYNSRNIIWILNLKLMANFNASTIVEILYEF